MTGEGEVLETPEFDSPLTSEEEDPLWTPAAMDISRKDDMRTDLTPSGGLNEAEPPKDPMCGTMQAKQNRDLSLATPGAFDSC